jgi:hypothetical protein
MGIFQAFLRGDFLCVYPNDHIAVHEQEQQRAGYVNSKLLMDFVGDLSFQKPWYEIDLPAGSWVLKEGLDPSGMLL